MKIENLLTIFLPIKDRPTFTKRCLNYLSLSKCKFPILIADGSVDNAIEIYLEKNVKELKLNIIYKRYPADSSFKIFLNKLSNSMELVKTPFVIWAADDDFYNLNELEKGINFLINNKDYKSYSAEVANFKIINIDKKKNSSRAFGKLSLRQLQYSYKGHIDDPKASKRIERYDDLHSVECIHYTSSLTEIFNIAKKVNADSFFVLGPIFQYFTLIIGKSFYSKEVFMLRQDDTPVSAGRELFEKDISIIHMLGQEDYTLTIFKIFDLLTEVYKKNSSPYRQTFKSHLLKTWLSYSQKRIDIYLKTETQMTSASHLRKYRLFRVLKSIYHTFRVFFIKEKIEKINYKVDAQFKDEVEKALVRDNNIL